MGKCIVMDLFLYRSREQYVGDVTGIAGKQKNNIVLVLRFLTHQYVGCQALLGLLYMSSFFFFSVFPYTRFIFGYQIPFPRNNEVQEYQSFGFTLAVSVEKKAGNTERGFPPKPLHYSMEMDLWKKELVQRDGQRKLCLCVG